MARSCWPRYWAHSAPADKLINKVDSQKYTRESSLSWTPFSPFPPPEQPLAGSLNQLSRGAPTYCRRMKVERASYTLRIIPSASSTASRPSSGTEMVPFTPKPEHAQPNRRVVLSVQKYMRRSITETAMDTPTTESSFDRREQGWVMDSLQISGL